MTDNTAEQIHALPSPPVHLHQLNTSAEAYNNPMGCGAFTTAMALSAYNPRKYGTYYVARRFFERMFKVPFLGGTFEHQNARIARRQGFRANSYNNGTLDDLKAAIDAGAPTIILINPGFLGYGRHDVLLVGYSTNARGKPERMFIDNPAHAQATQSDPRCPGNESIAAADMGKRWTGVFTPVFAREEQEAVWLERTGRSLPRFNLLRIFG